jgi:hypothetical protein
MTPPLAFAPPIPTAPPAPPAPVAPPVFALPSLAFAPPVFVTPPPPGAASEVLPPAFCWPFVTLLVLQPGSVANVLPKKIARIADDVDLAMFCLHIVSMWLVHSNAIFLHLEKSQHPM